MNKDIFKAIMRPALESNTTRDGNQFGELLATAYSYSTLGFAKTLYGAKLIQGQKAFLQEAISNEVNSNSRMNCCSPLSSKMVSVETVFNSSKGLSPIICLNEGKEIFSSNP